MKRKRTRNRSPQPQWSYGGVNLAQWQAATDYVLWAQTSPHFRDILTVFINERERLVLPIPGASENMTLGINIGYDRAIALLRDMAKGFTPPAPREGEPTYEAEAPSLSDVAND